MGGWLLPQYLHWPWLCGCCPVSGFLVAVSCVKLESPSSQLGWPFAL